MRLKKPKLNHAPEIYAAISREHGSDPLRMAQTLQALGWPLADAARAAVQWDAIWMAAAIAAEKQKRGIKLHSLTDEALAVLRAGTTAEQSSADLAKSEKIPRTTRNKPRAH